MSGTSHGSLTRRFFWCSRDQQKERCYDSNKKGDQHANVVDGGFISLEMAENLAQRGFQVTIIELLNQVMALLDYEMATILCDYSVKISLPYVTVSRPSPLILNKAEGCLRAATGHLQARLVAPQVASLNLTITWSVSIHDDVAE